MCVYTCICLYICMGMSICVCIYIHWPFMHSTYQKIYNDLWEQQAFKFFSQNTISIHSVKTPTIEVSFKMYLFIPCVWKHVCLHVCKHTTCLLSACRGWRRPSDPLELESPVLVNHCVDWATDPTPQPWLFFLFKSSSHLKTAWVRFMVPIILCQTCI